MAPSSASSKPHFLLLPLPAQGHFTPMLSLASRLAALGCPVTLLKVHKAPFFSSCQHPANNHTKLARGSYGAMQPEVSSPPSPAPPETRQEGHIYPAISTEVNCTTDAPSNIFRLLRFRDLPRTVGSSLQPIDAGSPRLEILKHTLASLEERQGLVEKMVQESMDSEAPISCIICDHILFRWVVKVAKKQGIRAAALVSCAAINFYAPYLSAIGKWEEGQELYRQATAPSPNASSMSDVSRQEQRHEQEQRKRMPGLLDFISRMYEAVEDASHILINSFKHLESGIPKSMAASTLSIRFIGPCLPAWEDAGGTTSRVGDTMAKQAGCMHTEDLGCLAWLDRQEKGSVLLVSFGSEAILGAEQVQELAMGLETSACKFLWVVRGDVPGGNAPAEEFQGQMKERGMFVPWVPQRKVLQHGATGGFLTHCGWNSTMESITNGVPMLCLPVQDDQFINAGLIHSYWKVGLPLAMSTSSSSSSCGVARREEVERAVRTLMGSEELHHKALQFQEQARSAISESQECLISFVQDIANTLTL